MELNAENRHAYLPRSGFLEQIIDADSNENISTFADVLASSDFDKDSVNNDIEYMKRKV